MSLYISPTLPPGIEVDRRALEFLSNFYKLSDTPEAHEAYAAQFMPDAKLAMGRNSVAGAAAVLDMRTRMWAGVAKRDHTVSQIYPFGPGSLDLMLFGTVTYTTKSGEQSGKDWAARAVLVEDASGALKLQDYKVYLVSTTRPLSPIRSTKMD